MPDASARGSYHAAIARRYIRELQAIPPGVPKGEEWHYGQYSIEELAQDQAIIRIVRGPEVLTYSALHRATVEDVQSDSTRLIAAREDWLAVVEAIVGKHAHQSFWQVEVPVSVLVDAAESGVAQAQIAWPAESLAHAIVELDCERDWDQMREMILQAEDTGFLLQDCALVAPRLIEIAARRRDSNDPQDRPVVLSAIRTGASMLRPGEASLLLPLLEPNHAIETCSVAIKMIGRVFEAQPPADVDRHEDIACKVADITDSLLTPYAIAVPQSAAMAQLAVYALAAMGSRRMDSAVRKIRRLEMGWFTRRTVHRLRELKEYWGDRGLTVASAHRCLVERGLEELQR